MPSVTRSVSPSSTFSLDSDVSRSSLESNTLYAASLSSHAGNALPQDDRKSYVMVLGGLGYIGSHTVLELLQEGFNVSIIDDLSNSYEDVVHRISLLAKRHCHSGGTKMPTLRFHALDYRSPAMRDLLVQYANAGSQISAMIHFAAFKSVSESIDCPLAYYRNNVCGLVDLLSIISEFGVKNFVFSSSATVYGAKSNAGKQLREDDLLHFDEIVVDENGIETVGLSGAVGLTSPYGRTKYFAEAILADLARADPSMRITALRYFNPVGCHPSGVLFEDPRQQPTNLFPVVASVIQGKRPELQVFGNDWDTRDGTAVRDFIHVVDLARGHTAAVRKAAADSTRAPFRAYNLGTGKGMTVAEVISSFEKATKQQIPTVLAPRRAGDVGSCVAVTTRAETELGWQATKTVNDCARDCWTALSMG